MVNNFQRAGSASNSHVGNAFEAAAREYFRQHGTTLQRNYQVPVGFSSKKPRKFDLEVWPESHWPRFALRQTDVLQSYTA